MVVMPMDVRFLQCDSKCETISLSASNRGQASINVVSGPKTSWTTLIDENGTPFLFLTPTKSGEMIAVRKTQIVKIDLASARYRILFTHKSVVFHPSISGDTVLFSDSPLVSQRSVNTYQNRRLYHYSISSRKLTHLLPRWNAYNIDTPYVLNDGRYCFSMSLPTMDGTSITARASDFKKLEAFCFPKEGISRADTNENDIRNAALPGISSEFYGLTIDPSGRFVTGYTIKFNSSVWMIYDLDNKRTLKSITANNNRITLSLDGTRYVYAEGRIGGEFFGTVNAMPSGSRLRSFNFNLNFISKTTLFLQSAKSNAFN